MNVESLFANQSAFLSCVALHLNPICNHPPGTRAFPTCIYIHPFHLYQSTRLHPQSAAYQPALLPHNLPGTTTTSPNRSGNRTRDSRIPLSLRRRGQESLRRPTRAPVRRRGRAGVRGRSELRPVGRRRRAVRRRPSRRRGLEIISPWSGLGPIRRRRRALWRRRRGRKLGMD